MPLSGFVRTAQPVLGFDGSPWFTVARPRAGGPERRKLLLKVPPVVHTLVKPSWMVLYVPRILAPALVAADGHLEPRFVAHLLLLVLVGCAAICALDEYLDSDQDGQEDPARPIPSGSLHPRHALTAAALMGTLSAYASWTIGPTTFLLACLIATLFILSSTVLRGTILSVVSIPATSSLVLVLSYTTVSPPDWLLLPLWLIHVLWDFGHDTAETLADPWSVIRRDRGTLPFIIGVGRATAVILCSAGLTLLMSVLFGVLAGLGMIYFTSVLIAALPYGWAVLNLRRGPSQSRAQQAFLWISRFQTIQFSAIALDLLLL